MSHSSLRTQSLTAALWTLSTANLVNAQYTYDRYGRRGWEPTRAIIGAVIGGVLLLLLLLIIFLGFRRRRITRHRIANGEPVPTRGRFGFGPMLFMHGGNVDHHQPPPPGHHQSYHGPQGYGGPQGYDTPRTYSAQGYSNQAAAGENKYNSHAPPPPAYRKDLEAGERAVGVPTPPPAAYDGANYHNTVPGFPGGFRQLN